MVNKSKDSDSNYLAIVILCPEPAPHPNADKLETISVFGGTVIVGKGSYQKGDKLVYFPIDSCIDLSFLSWANLLDRAELNADGQTKGFFGKHGRVKAVRLRGIPSEGFVFHASKLSEFFNGKNTDFKVGNCFDLVGEKTLVKKYISGQRATAQEKKIKRKIPAILEKTILILPMSIRPYAFGLANKIFAKGVNRVVKSIVPGQFHFHYSTPQLGVNSFLISPESDIVITAKYHGTSSVFANILTKNFGIFGFRRKYKFIYSSRSVVKNRSDGKYTPDIWGEYAKKMEGKIPEGITVYAEISGYNNGGGCIQKGYDYGCKPGESKLNVYRATHVNESGVVRELSWEEILTLCNDIGIQTAPLYYRGKAGDLFEELSVFDEQWNEIFVSKLRDKYLEKDCVHCVNKVPGEGICVRLEDTEKKTTLKFKSFAFYEKDTKNKDAGEEDLEEIS